MKYLFGRLLRAFVPALLVAGLQAHAADAAPTPAEPSARYTFAWPIDATAPKPRGGVSRGAPVVLDTEPSAAWQALQAPGLMRKERDRRAILAMSGTFRAGFDFLEVDTFVATPKPLAPYQSWGTEKVYVDKDEPGFISLVHIIEMRIVDAKGAISEPMVMKHWRQDWAYEAESIVEYRGNDRWQSRRLADAERSGNWVQTVYQVDESPRYASTGRWQHSATLSTWISADTWRPLPRREWSVRSDYQVLIGTNRHTVRPTGWTQEENNLKAVLTAQRDVDASKPYLAREYGVARYDRLRDPSPTDTAAVDFKQADHYYERTRAFWDGVRDAWSGAFAQQGTITLRGPVDKLGLFMPLFERAGAIETDGSKGRESDAAFVRSALTDMGVYR
ncbi:hypothetical protein BH09PSE5_BH09PSE5_18110 [soil metagenome]